MRFAFSALILALALACAACHNSPNSTGPTPLPQPTQPTPLAQAVSVTKFNPESGSVVQDGTGFSFVVKDEHAVGWVSTGLAFVRDDGMNMMLNFCPRKSGGPGYGEAGFEGRVNPAATPIWQKGHTVKAVVIASYSEKEPVECWLSQRDAEGPNWKVDWSIVQYQRDIATWSIQ